MRRRALRAIGGVCAAALLGWAAPAHAQDAGLVAPCLRSEVPAGARDYCVAVAQALTSAQPQVGMLLAGGNPLLGSASTAGLRLSRSPGASAVLKANFVEVRIPDVLDRDAAAAGGALSGERSVFAPSISGTLALNLTPGVDLAPTVGGIGSVDLLGSLGWVPLRALGVSAFRLEMDEFAYAIGARVGVLRESFTLPGASVSLLYRRFGEVGYGSVCRTPLGTTTTTEEGYRFSAGTCPGEGDPGELSLDLTNWSARGVLGKQLGRIGVAAGAGFDRFDSDVGLGFRAPAGGVPGVDGFAARASDLRVESDRWSFFGNASYTSLVTTFTLEAGWMRGGEAVAGFPAGGDFDPGRGTLFGSIGVRLAY